jgi:hypothetical protein
MPIAQPDSICWSKGETHLFKRLSISFDECGRIEANAHNKLISLVRMDISKN